MTFSLAAFYIFRTFIILFFYQMIISTGDAISRTRCNMMECATYFSKQFYINLDLTQYCFCFTIIIILTLRFIESVPVRAHDVVHTTLFWHFEIAWTSVQHTSFQCLVCRLCDNIFFLTLEREKWKGRKKTIICLIMWHPNEALWIYENIH